MKVNRLLKQELSKFSKGRVNVLYGPRRVGKTTLVKEIFKEFPNSKLYLTGDDVSVQGVFDSITVANMRDLAEDISLLIIDEAQRIANIGQGLKLLIDEIPNLKVIVTGSASFELAGQVGEPLTGRKREFLMYPLSLDELKRNGTSLYMLKQELEKQLIFGLYPEVYSQKSKSLKESTLRELVNSLLLKDILELERVKGSKILLDLLRLIAYQIGSEVSLTELASNLGIDYKTVGRYLDLFEKSFILFNLRGYSRNLRKEVNKKSKYYFYDNGVRNALILNFNEIEIRNDIGQLWENFIISERLKSQSHRQIASNNYFWRTWDNEEIDWIEERRGKLYGFEFKYKQKAIVNAPKTFSVTYPHSTFSVIDSTNYLEWLI